jgi:hypothetical protein
VNESLKIDMDYEREGRRITCKLGKYFTSLFQKLLLFTSIMAIMAAIVPVDTFEVTASSV